jgi:predicted nucleotidyltransferase component of viral defense system
MNLHLDKNSFWSILQIANNTTGIRTDVLEKDYYVTLFLKELADMQDTLPAYFKGGTALYKALHSIRRFSEDIDLTVCIDGCTNSQAKKRLERAANGYLSFTT